MTENLEGWELHSEDTYDVTDQDGRGLVRQRIFVKQIDGKWYYKTISDEKRQHLIKYGDIDGENDPIYELEEVKFDD
jgi:hypothetical protein